MNTTREKLLFIGKGGKKEGMGHLVRIATLAEVLAEKYDVTVITQQDRFGDFFFKQKRVGCDHYKNNRDLYGFLQKTGPYRVIIIDVYRIGIAVINRISQYSSFIINFDDMRRRVKHGIKGAFICPQEPFNHSLEKTGERMVFSGTDYFPLRPVFAETRVTRKFRPGVFRVGIILGGVPSKSVTLEFARQMDEILAPYVCLDVVLGYDPDEVNEKSFPGRVHFLKNVENMAAFLASLDVAIIAGGFIKFEAMCMGTPFALVSLCSHQQKLARVFAHEGYGIYLGPVGKLTGTAMNQGAFKRKMLAFIGNKSLREEIFTRSRLLVDGQGSERIAELVTQLENDY